MRIALLSCALMGCAYQPGSFVSARSDFTGQRATVGCLDVAVERRGDLPIGPVLNYEFANRCDHVTMIDLGAVTVVGRNLQGTEVLLLPYDPRSEIQPVALDGRKIGGESLAYPSDRPIPQVCVDLATLAHAGTRAGAPHWMCFESAAMTVAQRVR